MSPPSRTTALVLAGLVAVTSGVVGLGLPGTASAADPVVVQDDFARVVANGWGATPAGAPYTVSDAGAFSIDGTAAVVRQSVAGKRLYADLPASDLRDGLVSAVFTSDKPAVGWGQVFSLVQRHQLDGQGYEARLRLAAGGAAYVGFLRRSSTGAETAIGAETAVALTPAERAAVAAGSTPVHLAFEATGATPTTLRARTWVAGSAEPAAWTSAVTDPTRQLAGPGSVGISTVTSSSTTNLPVAMRVDDLTVTDSTAVAPIAAGAVPVPRYGAVPLGTARYAVPGGARYVSPRGSDAAAGTAGDPWLTLGKAAAAAPSGSTVVLRGGTYRESVSVYRKRLTIQNYPGERVYLTGSDPVTGWVADGSAYRVDGWAARFAQGGRPDLTDPAHPLSAYPDMVFVDGMGQQQVASRAAVVSGSFFVDYAAKQLFLGSSPAGHAVEASTRRRGLYLNKADGSVVRGIAVVHYANHPDDLGALLDDGDGTVIENCLFSENASTGLSVLGKGAAVLNDTLKDNGQLGLHADHADGLQVRRSLLQHNDTEAFAVTGAEGNLKVTATDGVVVAGNLSRWSVGRGMWFDVDSYAVTAVDNVIAGNGDRGLQLEISGHAVLASNLVVGNAADGISVISSNDVAISHNSFWGNARAVFVVSDDRRRSDPRIPQTVQEVSLRNNVMSGSRPGTLQIVAVEDTTRSRTAAAMGVTADDDAYAQVGVSGAASWTGWADYPSAYLVFSSLSAFTSRTGQETAGLGVAAGAEPFFTSPATGSFRLQAGSAVAAMAGAPLPASVAAALGVAAGTVLPMGSRVVDTAAS